MNQFQARFSAVVAGDDFHNVEAERDIGIIQHAEPGQRAAGDVALLIGKKIVHRTPQCVAASALHFYKDKRVIIATDNIDLPAAAWFEIAVENFVTVSAEKFGGEFFAPRP